MGIAVPLRGVVLLNMGGPDSLGAVRPYLARLFLDRDLIRLPAAFLTQPLFAWAVSAIRARTVRRYYEDIGGASPIGALTERQRAALEERLRASGGRFRVFTAMRYWHPSAKNAVLEMKEENVDEALALPLYPQYCSATTGSSLKDLRRWMRWAGASFPLREVPSWPDHPGYVAALARKVEEAVAKAQGAQGTIHILFSAHGIPKYLADEKDPYPAEVARTVTAVMRGFPGLPHSIAYQSRVGPIPWLGPDTVEEVRRLGAEGVGALVVVPVSFVSDHIETLHELDIRLRRTAQQAGIGRFVRAAALNDSPDFIEALADIVRSAAGANRLGEKPTA